MEQVTERFEQLPLAALRESPRNTRRTYNEAKLAELTESVKTKGIITPLIARPLAGETGVYEIGAGHRRFRAAMVAGIATAPVIIRDYSDDEFLEVLTIENLQREDVHPMEEAQGYAELLKRPGYDVGTLAQKLVKSESYIYQRLKLLELIPDLRDQFAADKIQFGHALILCRLEPVTQADIFKHELHYRDDGCITVQALRNHVERNIYLDLGKAAFPIMDPGLRPMAGSCDACSKRTGFNPSLFPEVKAKDHCLDRACYHQKANAYASRQLAKLTAEIGTKPLTISTASKYNSAKKPGVLTEDQWRRVKKGTSCPSTKKAVVVELSKYGDEKEQLGHVIDVCVDKKCTAHWRSIYDSRPPKAEMTVAELKRELAIKEKTESEAAVSQARIAAAVDAAVYPLEPKIFKELAAVMWGRVWHDHRVRVLARRGLKQQSSRDPEAKDVMLEAIAKSDPEQLAGLVIEIAIMESGSRHQDSGPVMLELALGAIAKPVLEKLEEDARAAVRTLYDQKRFRIDKAASKKAAAIKAEKAAAKAPAKKLAVPKPTARAKKGKGKK